MFSPVNAESYFAQKDLKNYSGHLSIYSPVCSWLVWDSLTYGYFCIRTHWVANERTQLKLVKTGILWKGPRVELKEEL